MFLEALNKVLKHEGYYSFNPNDKGGETYQGIARNYHPKWLGWALVDKEKQKYGGALKRNYVIEHPLMKGYVQAFYKEKFWDRIYLSQVKDENLQNIIFDGYVNAGSNAIRILQSTLNKTFGLKLKADGAQGLKTVAAINSVNPQQLFEAYKKARTDYYYSIAKGNNAVFLKGWLNRISSFNYTTVGLSMAGLVVLGVAGFFL